MSKNKPTLEELRKENENLIRELNELNREKQIVIASMSNADHTQLMYQLNNRNVVPKHIQELLRLQSKRAKLDKDKEIADDKLMEYYKIFTGIEIENTSFEIVDDNKSDCIYMYELNANIERLRFSIIYRSNKPPDVPLGSKEVITKLVITLEKASVQKEIQEGLDYFAENPEIPCIILFLRSVYELNNIRKRLIKDLLLEYKSYIDTGIDNVTSAVVIDCHGIEEKDYFLIYWAVKWDSKTNLAKDSLIIKTFFSDDELIKETESVFNKMCANDKWDSLTFEGKFNLFVSAMKSFIDADGRKRKNKANVFHYRT